MKSTDGIDAAVSRVAAGHGFGDRVAARTGDSRPMYGLIMGILAIGAFGLGVLAGWLSSATGIRLLVIPAIVLIVLSPVLIGFGVLYVVRGSQSYYLYQGGLVRTWNGRPRAIPWHQIRQVVRSRVDPRQANFLRDLPGLEWVDENTVDGYLIRPAGGPPVRIGLRVDDDPEYARFCENLERLTSQGGAPVIG